MIGLSLSTLGLAWASAYASTVLWAALRSGRRSIGGRGARRGVGAIVIRPCAGEEPGLARALASTAAFVAGTGAKVRLAVASRDDGAFATADAACRSLRAQGIDATLVTTGAVGSNRKADQLARVLAREAGDFDTIVTADSDVDLSSVSFDALTAPLTDSRVAAVWAPPIEITPRTSADRASRAVLDRSLHAFAVLGALDPAGMVGKLLVVRARDLEAVGGFAHLVAHLGEDMELARRLRARGREVRMAGERAPSLAQGRTWGQAVARYARWITVIRAQRPHLLVAYPALFFAAPLLLAFAGVLLGLGLPHAGAIATLAVGARLVLAWVAHARSGSPGEGRRLVADIVTADALLAAAFTRALLSRRTRWRGVELRPGGRHGLLTSEEPP